MDSPRQRHRIVYHGTSSWHLREIAREGLIAPAGYAPTNYTVAATPGFAGEYAKYTVRAEKRRNAKPVVLTLSIPEEDVDKYLFRPERQYGYLGRAETVYAQRRPIPARYVVSQEEVAW